MALYETLFDGPLDFVGDIHGEITALRHLFYKLGYDDSGCHPAGRRLVFLGDLIDRGPDSPAVLDAVMTLVNTGKAQCVLGNHELNILLNRPMHGNGWIIQDNPKETPSELKSRIASSQNRSHYLEFMSSLPLVLENSSFRIAHACWNNTAVDLIKKHNNESVTEVYNVYQQQYEAFIGKDEFAGKLQIEQTRFHDALRDPEQQPPLLPTIAEKERLEQMMNPVRMLTTSSMQVAKEPFFGGGKWRMAERDAWWNSYRDEKPVVIGHFWRQFNQLSDRISGVFGKDLFQGIPSHAWVGANHNVYCVDYSVGQRHLERKEEDTGEFLGKLAALRMPARQVMHDDGSVIATN